jgi:hypothetical protein
MNPGYSFLDDTLGKGISHHEYLPAAGEYPENGFP